MVKMEIINVNQTKVFGKSVRTSLKTIGEHVKVLPESILVEMNPKGFKPEGPQVWIYLGADGNPDTEFDLLVGFPVSERALDENIVALKNFKCVSAIHKGDWASFSETYCKIIEELMQKGLQMTGECREIYHQVDFENVENNITEIQIGIN